MCLLVVAVLLWICSLAVAVGKVAYARLAAGGRKGGGSVCPPVTLVLLAHNQEQELRESLPLFLSQDYPGEMYVSVVDIRSEDETLRYLEDMEGKYRILSHCSVPASAKDISLQRLAMTLGLRSAPTDWVIFSHAGCSPTSSSWLVSFASHCGEDKDAVVGTVVLQLPLRGDDTKYQWMRLRRQCLWMPWAEKGKPVAAEDSLFACRAGFFMGNGGFGKDNILLCGASTLLLNRQVEPGRCASAMGRDCVLTERLCGVNRWTQDRMYLMEVASRTRRPLLYKVRCFMDVVLPLLLLLFGAATMVVFRGERAVLVAVPVMLLIGMLVRSWAFFRVCRSYGVPGCFISNMWYELAWPFWIAGSWFRWKTSGRNAFRKKFL